MAMNRNSLIIVSLSLAGAFLLGACHKSDRSDPAREAPITGKRSDPPTALKGEWKPGSHYNVRLESTQTSTVNFRRQPSVQETSVEQDYALVVTNTPEGNRSLDLELQALVVDSRTGDRPVYRFDSLNKVTPNEGPGVEMLQRVIGGHIRFLVNSNNHVLRVDGLAELIARAQGDQGRGAPDQRRNWMGGVLQRVFNADYFKQLVDLNVLPGTAVRIGDTWTRQEEIDVGMVGRVLVNTTNTLRGWQVRDGRKCARLEFSGVLGMKSGKAEGVLGFMGLHIEDGRVSGTCWFDPQIGLPFQTTLEQSCTITGTLPDPGRRGNRPQGTNNTSSPFTSPWQQSTTLTLTEAQPAPAAKPNG